MDADNRRPVGGHVEVILKLRTPILFPDIVEIEDKWIFLKKPVSDMPSVPQSTAIPLQNAQAETADNIEIPAATSERKERKEKVEKDIIQKIGTSVTQLTPMPESKSDSDDDADFLSK